MFQFPTFPSIYYFTHIWISGLFPPDEFPHSDICESIDICSSSQLFAAYHVLHRLLVPRHSPYALSSLTSFVNRFFINPKTIFKVTNLILVYLIIHLYIFQCAFLKLLNFVYKFQCFFILISKIIRIWWSWGESNSWPPACKAGALANWATAPYDF